MARYMGQATVETPDEAVIEVMATLRSVRREGVVSWSGVVEGISKDGKAGLVGLSEGKLRTVATDEMSGFTVAKVDEDGKVEIVGTGQVAPF